jgi:hypothetical protein
VTSTAARRKSFATAPDDRRCASPGAKTPWPFLGYRDIPLWERFQVKATLVSNFACAAGLRRVRTMSVLSNVLTTLGMLGGIAALPATPVFAAATCFGQNVTVYDNGPGDMDPRPHFIKTVQKSVIQGTDGNDVIDASSMGDLICSLGGNDRIHAVVGGKTSIDAGDGDDSVTISTAPQAVALDYDYVSLGQGNDTLSGDDRFYLSVQTGDGQNRVNLKSDGILVIYGGAGRDVVDIQALTGGVFTGAGDDRIRVAASRPGTSPFVNIDAGAGDDVIDLPDGLDWSIGPQPPGITGGEGDDRVSVGVGGVAVDGGPGDDLITWHDGTRSGLIVGGDGNDVIRVDSAVSVGVSGGAGNDKIRYSAPALCGDGFDPLGLCRISGGAGQDHIRVSGSGIHHIFGDDGDDVLRGGPQDILNGGNGRDVCRGGSQATDVGCEVMR